MHSLSQHMKSDVEERPYKCNICGKRLKTRRLLKNHHNTHTGTRPYCCGNCEASFVTYGELVRHVRYRHTHEKPYSCKICEYKCVESKNMQRHMRHHTGERPYQCPSCTYASPDSSRLKRHLRIHTGEKPYECDICHLRFSQSSSRKMHKIFKHSEDKLYSLKSFTQKNESVSHKQHREKLPLKVKEFDEGITSTSKTKLENFYESEIDLSDDGNFKGNLNALDEDEEDYSPESTPHHYNKDLLLKLPRPVVIRLGGETPQSTPVIDDKMRKFPSSEKRRRTQKFESQSCITVQNTSSNSFTLTPDPSEFCQETSVIPIFNANIVFSESVKSHSESVEKISVEKTSSTSNPNIVKLSLQNCPEFSIK